MGTPRVARRASRRVATTRPTMAPPVKQSSLLGFFSKVPGKAPAPEVATPPSSGKRTHDTPAPASSPTPAPAKRARASITPPPSSDAPDVDMTEAETPVDAVPPADRNAGLQAMARPPDAPPSSPPPPGRRARRVNYAEPKADSDSDGASEQERSEDEFVLSEQSEDESESESEASVVESEEPETADESESDEPKPAPPPRRATAPPQPLPTAPTTARSHLTKAEQRAADERRRRLESEEAYSFLLDVRDKDGHRPGDLEYDQRTLYIPPSAWRSFTPFEKQFWEIKQNHFDTVLFFQKGKFYELYEDDAMIGHRECDLKLTDRVKMKMVGVPEASFDMFATKLLALGYKVGRVDQSETAVAKGMRVGEKSRGGSSGEIVRRVLRHVVTGGTVVDGSVLSDELSSYCVCIKEARTPSGAPLFGVCTLDASTAEFRVLTFEDDAVLSQLETLLRSLRVKEVLHEKGVMSPGTLRLVRNTVPTTCQLTMLRPGTEFLTPDAARARLAALTGGMPPELAPLADCDVVLSALGGLLWYLEQLHLDADLCASSNFGVRDAPAQGGAMILDAKSLQHLHVLQNDEGGDEGTLHRLLNRCTTPFGRRLFKLWLASPLADARAIEVRLDAVDTFRARPALADVFVEFARSLPDLERLQSRVAAGKCRPRDFLAVLHAFGRFRKAQAAMAEQLEEDGPHSDALLALITELPDVSTLADTLRAHFTAGEDGSFTPVSGECDAYDRAVETVQAAEARLDDEFDACINAVGVSRRDAGWKHIGTNEIYQLEVPARAKVPANWLLMSQTKAVKRYYTPRTRELIRQLKEARETRLAALRGFQDDIYAQFRANLVTYARAVRGVAQIDCLLSLARASEALGAACRPVLETRDTAAFSFTELRHPCIAPSVLSGTTEFIPNDISLGGEAEEVMVLTGGNMAGKSTTARTAATAVILAQIGCYVPAASAWLAPVDRIASRMGANDQLFRQHSTFMVEMLEASKILRDATPRSLVIMDELGRGTSTFDGQAIAYAVLHEIAVQTRCLCFFMTHYTTLAECLDAYPRIANRHMEVRVGDTVIFTYRLVPGVAASSYGTQVAAIAGVPPEVCAKAADVSREFFDQAQAEHARRMHSRIPLETLADFARLYRAGKTQEGELGGLLAVARRCHA